MFNGHVWKSDWSWLALPFIYIGLLAKEQQAYGEGHYIVWGKSKVNVVVSCIYIHVGSVVH